MMGLFQFTIKIIASISPTLVVFYVLSYITKKGDNERRNKKIKHQYTVKSEKILLVFFILAFLIAVILAYNMMVEKEVFAFIILLLWSVVILIGCLNIIFWKIEVNGDTIIYTSTFNKKRVFSFRDIIYVEDKRHSTKLYINGNCQFTIKIDDNIYDCDFMDDVFRRVPYVYSLERKDKLWKGNKIYRIKIRILKIIEQIEDFLFKL